MAYASCPTNIVNAPVEIVWTLLTRPEGWGDFYDVRIAAIEPPGPAVVGQTVFAESGPWPLHLKLKFRFTKIDAVNYKLGLDVRLPFGITVRAVFRSDKINAASTTIVILAFQADGAARSRAFLCVAS